MIGLGLNVWRGVSGVGMPPFAISRLFDLGEQGFWYDPSDLSTLFQDAAGMIPVTAVEQPVGLMLDKSKGLALGPELVVNGDFSSATGWTLQSGWTISGGTLNGTPSAAFASAGSTASLVAGRAYQVSFDIISYTSGAVRPRFSGGTEVVGAVDRTSIGTFTEILVATTGNTTINVQARAAGFNGSVDNISVKELPGNHASQATAASRPLYRSPPAKIDYDGIDDVLNITFPVSLGSNVTIARAIPGVGAQILTGQTVGTTYADNVDHAGLIIVNRALTAAETSSVTKYLNAKAGV